ncbi:glycosyltransferase [Clostridium sp.]|uniref:glycosyltransferase n=1 Tax=Clostridium sp. TaxID=1506 RepID=UPI00262F38E1|nr:glycosyltransferase [Clostridium sp.]
MNSKKVIFIVPKDYKKIGGLNIPIGNYSKFLENKYIVEFIFIPYKFDKKDKINFIKKIQDVNWEDVECVISCTLNPAYSFYKLFKKNIKIRDIKKVAFLMDSLTLYANSILEFNKIKKIKNTKKRQLEYWLKSKLYKFKERNILRYYDEVVYVSNVDCEYVKDIFKKSISAKLKVIPNGIKKNKSVICDYSIKENKYFNIGFINTFVPGTIEENLQWFLVECMPKIVEVVPNARIIIAGRGASTEQIEFLNGFKYVKYLGEVGSLCEFYNCVDIILSTVEKRNGLLNKNLEAFSYQKCVVGFEWNFFAFDNAKPNKHYLKANNIDEFIKIFKDIQDKKIDINIIAKEAKIFSDTYYNWDESNSKFYNVVASNEIKIY